MEKNILERIAEKTRERVAEEKKAFPLERLRKDAEEHVKKQSHRSFYAELSSAGLSYICEVKKASPSKGTIVEKFPYISIAKAYEAAGASAVSCLTEPFFFKGKDSYLSDIVNTVDIPVLRKDFIVDEYMIYQAAVLGASAVLLLCNILDDAKLLEYRLLAEELKMDALVEAYDGEEFERALRCGAKVVGVNNRDLRTFEVDTGRSIAFKKQTPAGVVFVSESGIENPEDIARLKEAGVDAVLIGETLMRADDKAEKLAWLNSGRIG